MQSDLDQLSEWLQLNKLKLNVKKTKCMVLHKEALSPMVELYVENQLIETVTNFKFLGIHLDNAMMFSVHHDELISKLLKSSFVIKTLSKFLPSSIMRTLYFAYYESHLVYGCCIWYPLLSKQSQVALYQLQKCLICTLCNVPFRSHCMPLYKKLSIMTLPDLVKLENCKLCYRVVSGLCANPLRSFFVKLNGPDS